MFKATSFKLKIIINISALCFEFFGSDVIFVSTLISLSIFKTFAFCNFFNSLKGYVLNHKNTTLQKKINDCFFLNICNKY